MEQLNSDITGNQDKTNEQSEAKDVPTLQIKQEVQDMTIVSAS